MREKLIEILKSYTCKEVNDIVIRLQDATVQEFNCCRAIRLLIKGKPASFIQFIDSGIAKKNKASFSAATITQNKDKTYKINYDTTQVDSLSEMLRYEIAELEQMPYSEFRMIKYSDDDPVLRAVAIAMLRGVYAPNMLGKLLAIFDGVGNENTFAVKEWIVEDDKVKEKNHGSK